MDAEDEMGTLVIATTDEEEVKYATEPGRTVVSTNDTPKCTIEGVGVGIRSEMWI